jgi:Immunity protein Imm1
MATEVVGTFRIGGGGVFSEKFTAETAEERVALVDQYLSDHPAAVMFLEVKRDARSWEDWQSDPREVEFLRVGVNGAYAAAEYVSRGPADQPVIRATHNPAPIGTEPAVPYDDHAPRQFPASAVVSIVDVRRLMVGFASTGTWPESVASQSHDHLIV